MQNRTNTTEIGSRMYIVGWITAQKPTQEQATALGSTSILGTFLRLSKCGVMYHYRNYPRVLKGKRRNTFCCYTIDSIENLGEVKLFVMSPQHCALIRNIMPLSTMPIYKAGNPSRPALSTYIHADLLKNFIIPVDTINLQTLKVIPVDCIMSKVVFVNSFDQTYCVKQPNILERH